MRQLGQECAILISRGPRALGLTLDPWGVQYGEGAGPDWSVKKKKG